MKYNLIDISSETLSALLLEEFKNLEELTDYEFEQRTKTNSDTNISVLINYYDDDEKGEQINIVESIFTNE